MRFQPRCTVEGRAIGLQGDEVVLEGATVSPGDDPLAKTIRADGTLLVKVTNPVAGVL